MSYNIIGIDEAGRGCVVGSMFIVGILPTNDKFFQLDLKDSKKLTKDKREELAYRIRQYAKIKIVKISHKAIDKFGISYCYTVALKQIVDFFSNYCLMNDIDCQFIFDGNTNFGVDIIDTMIKGDNKLKEIMAASIIAKNKKDKEMERLHKKFPQYDWINNNGYLTKEHKSAIILFGITDYHRKSFKLPKRKEDKYERA